eukprot:4450013-Amphidinium_carterae.2
MSVKGNLPPTNPLLAANRPDDLLKGKEKHELGCTPHVNEDLLRMMRLIMESFQAEWFPGQTPPGVESTGPT